MDCGMEEGSVKLQFPLKKESSVRILRCQEWLSLEPQVEGFALEKKRKISCYKREGSYDE